MSASLPQTDESIFAEALSCADPQQRADFVARACGDDAALRSQVEELLQHHAAAAGFLETPVVSPADQTSRPHSAISTGRPSPDGAELRWSAETAVAQLLTPADDPTLLGTIGPYAVTEMIGRGGMGVVLKARDDSLGRVVAIKVLAPELAGNATARKRFLREGRAAAAITHPHVVTIHAVAEDRLPYLVMEFICGPSLQAKLDEVGALPLTETLRIGGQIAAGLAAAHAQGVIHRDIKPSNVLLENGVERARITDFGLARAVDDVDITQTGEVAGTPPYMSPEQAQGHAVDARSDLFSLGCVLYAMCTGRSPFRAETAVATLRRVCDDAPRPITDVNPDVPEWLESLIERLLEKRPENRIQTAQEVADVLWQCLSHVQNPRVVPLPAVVQAPRRRARRSANWSRWMIAALLLMVAAGSLGVTEATGVTHLAGTVVRIVTGEGTLVIETDDPTVRVSLDGEELTISGGGVQEVRLRPGQYQFTATKDGRPVKQELVTITRGGEKVVTVSREATEPQTAASLASEEIRRFPGHTGIVWNVAYSPDGRHALSRGSDSTVRLWDIQSGQELRRFETQLDYVGVAFSSDGRTAICGHPAGGMMLWEVETGTELRRFGADAGAIYCLALSPNDQQALTGGSAGTMILWDVQTGEELRRFEGHTDNIYSVAFSPDTTQILSAGGGEINKEGDYPPDADNSVRLWDVETGNELGRFEHTSFIYRVVFSPDGRFGLSGSYDGTMRLWDLRKRRELRVFKNVGGVASVAFTPDGRFALSGGGMNYISLWEVDTGIRLQRFEGHTKTVQSLAVSPDGRSFLSGSWDGTMRLWQLPEAGLGQAPQPERGAFVLLGGKGVAERRFNTLAEAVASSSDGDTIEVRGNGPFVSDCAIVNHSLVVRAGTGYTPSILLGKESAGRNVPLFCASNGRVVLEGLELMRVGGAQGQVEDRFPQLLLAWDRGSLHIANCRLICKADSVFVEQGAGFTSRANSLSVRNSVLSGNIGTESSMYCESGGRYSIDNCVCAIGGIGFVPADPDVRDVAIRVRNNTLVGNCLNLTLFFKPNLPGAGEADRPLRLVCSGNVARWDMMSRNQAFLFFHQAQFQEQLRAAQAEAFLPRLVTLDEKQNVYWTGTPMLRLVADWKPLEGTRGQDLADWNRFWDHGNTGSVEGEIRFQGGDLIARARSAPEKLTAEDFRLRADSAGYRAGPEGQDLGADIDLVGPGPAYERWKQTPEYQQWLEASGQK